MQIHGSPSIVSIAFMACYIQTESNTARWQVRARGIGGKRLFEGNGRDTRWIVSDFVRALNEATEVKMAWVSGIDMHLEFLNNNKEYIPVNYPVNILDTCICLMNSIFPSKHFIIQMVP
jgi:hypothetical protein